MSQSRKPWRPPLWTVLVAVLLVATSLRAVAGANRYGNASDQFRLELVVSTLVTVLISAAVIMLIISIGERPGRLRAQRVKQASGPDTEVWAARVDSRSRAVLTAMSRADAGHLAKPGLYFVVSFDAAGLRIVTSTNKSSSAYVVPRERIRRVRRLDYRVVSGRSDSISIAFDRDGKRFDLPLVLVEWKFISHNPIGVDRNTGMIAHLQELWDLDPALVE